MEEHVDTLMGIILPFTNFAIFIAMALYFFKKPAKAAAQRQRDRFQELVAEAKSAKDAALAKLAQLELREAALDAELSELRAIATSTAELEVAKIVGDAERLAKHLQTEAKRIAEAEVNKARGELRREIVAAVQTSVTQKLQSELNVEAQHRLVTSKIGALQQLHVEH